MLRKRDGEYLLALTPKPLIAKPKPIWVNILLLLATIITTTLVGSQFWILQVERIGLQWSLLLLKKEYLLKGAIYFSLPLLLILGCHELGHYFVSRRYKVPATLPYFIPLPPIPGFLSLGTLGAVISTRGTIPNKRALLDIGIAGPLVGFLIAIPVTLIGLSLAQQLPPPLPPKLGETELVLGLPLLFLLLEKLANIAPLSLHPTLFAGWIGLLVTAMNLLPAGQLDGGHIAYASLGGKQKYTSVAALVLMLVLSYFFPVWILFAFIILLTGIRHPPPLNDITPLGLRGKLLAIFALLMFILSFVPIPIAPVQ
jgi:membrane-associated protease RseP (regulator of RpoE activity)